MTYIPGGVTTGAVRLDTFQASALHPGGDTEISVATFNMERDHHIAVRYFSTITKPNTYTTNLQGKTGRVETSTSALHCVNWGNLQYHYAFGAGQGLQNFYPARTNWDARQQTIGNQVNIRVDFTLTGWWRTDIGWNLWVEYDPNPNININPVRIRAGGFSSNPPNDTEPWNISVIVMLYRKA